MSLRKALGIIIFSTQMVVVVDYNMQSRQARLGPGELSMSDYAAIVQRRYDRPEGNRPAADADDAGNVDLWHKVSSFASGLEKRPLDEQELSEASGGDAAPEEPAAVCVRRATALTCQ